MVMWNLGALLFVATFSISIVMSNPTARSNTDVEGGYDDVDYEYNYKEVSAIMPVFDTSEDYVLSRMKRHGRGTSSFRAGQQRRRLAGEMSSRELAEARRQDAVLAESVGKGALFGALGGPPGLIAGAVAGLLKGRLALDLSRALNVTD